MRFFHIVSAAILAISIGPTGGLAQEQPGRDACVAQLKNVGGPDAMNGIDVLNTEFSQAGTMVTMRDAGGTVWQCIGYEDGAVGDLYVVDAADDGEGAMAKKPSGENSENDGSSKTIRVQFAAGTSGATYNDALTPGSSHRYVLGAKDGQFLDVRVDPDGAGFSYQIFNPDNTFLLEMIDPTNAYRGQLWQNGDHVVEVINRGTSKAFYRVVFGIE